MVRGLCRLIPSADYNHQLLFLQYGDHGSNNRSWHAFYLTISIILCTTALNLQPGAASISSISSIISTPSFDLHGAPQKLYIKQAAAKSDRHLLVAESDSEAMRALVGSSPPKCVKKCGACSPCESVLVPIHSNSPAAPAGPTQYYPEAWRCQCKGKIYNP